MARVRYKIGFAMQIQDPDDEWTTREVITERWYQGELQRAYSHRWQQGEHTIGDITLSNDFSILADSFAKKNYGYMRYVVIEGVKWKIDSVESEWPRLILSIGAIYKEDES